MEIRAFQGLPDLEIRSEAGERVIKGLALRWDTEYKIHAGLTEGWRSGSFDHVLPAFGAVKLSREHISLGGKLIGSGISAKNDSAGFYVEMSVAKTELGDETLALVENGALDSFSIGFNQSSFISENTRGRKIHWRNKADLVEVAVVLLPAYPDAKISLREDQFSKIDEILAKHDGYLNYPVL